MKIAVIYITHAGKAEAEILARTLVERKLVACSNIFPISSMYWWQGAIESEAEWVSVVKTSLEHWPIVCTAVQQLHPYQTPCILKFEAEANPAYAQWILDSIS